MLNLTQIVEGSIKNYEQVTIKELEDGRVQIYRRKIKQENLLDHARIKLLDAMDGLKTLNQMSETESLPIYRTDTVAGRKAEMLANHLTLEDNHYDGILARVQDRIREAYAILQYIQGGDNEGLRKEFSNYLLK
jgi:hypothetical protein